jgi:hypothetical protein
MKMKYNILILTLIVVFISFPSLISLGQNRPGSIDQGRHGPLEFLDQKYLPNQFNNKKTTPGMKYRTSTVFTTQVNVDSSGHNIVGDAANEPNIAIDPSYPNHIVIGWRQFDNVNSNFRQAGWAYSTDAGSTWTFPGVIDPGIFRSDPVLDYDTLGNFYYNSLTQSYNCRVFKSTNGGAVWDTGADAKGGDKQWMTIDRTRGEGSENIYADWNEEYTTCSSGNFTRSTDGGQSFGPCFIVNDVPYWGILAVGNHGELYISGTDGTYNGIIVTKSTNAKVPGSNVTWDFVSQVYMDGYVYGSPPINPVGILGQVSIDVDRSNGPGRDNVYVLASMPRLSTYDPGDVMFAKSSDGGLTWGNPVKVNDDNSTTNTQWFGVMSVAPTGRIDVAWLDTRDAPPGSDNSALYYSYSYDQGVTWAVNQKLSDSFDPHVGYPQQDKIGDYIDMISDSTGAHLAWANTLNGEEDVYYSHIIPPTINGIATKEAIDNYCSVSCFPNPVENQATIRYQIPVEGFVQLVICNVYGQELATLVNKNQVAGIYTLNFAADILPEGYYLCKLYVGGHTAIARMVRVK